MNAQEYEAWARSMKAARGHWTIDPIHNGLDGRDLLVFVPSPEDHTRGAYVRLDGAFAEAGTFEGAIPHIGEARFERRWSRVFEGAEEAFAKVSERLGVQFLLAGFTGDGVSPCRVA